MNNFSDENFNKNKENLKTPEAKKQEWVFEQEDLVDDTYFQQLGQPIPKSISPAANPVYRPARIRSAAQSDIAPKTKEATDQLDQFIRSLDEKMVETGDQEALPDTGKTQPQPITFSWPMVAALVGLVGAGWMLFVHYLYAGDSKNKIAQPTATLDLPITGHLVSLTDVKPQWRWRTDGDKAKAEAKILPTLTLETSGSVTGSGWVRVLFYDDVRVVRGDVSLVEVKNGRFVASTNPQAQVSAEGKKVTFSASDGFTNELTFVGYRQGIGGRWSAKIEESIDSKRSEWKTLGFIELGHELTEPTRQ